MAYPTSAQSFTTKTSSQTIEAEHVNTLQTEVTAIETGLLSGCAHDLLPSTDDARDLGTALLRWRTARLSTALILGPATTSGVRFDLESGTLALREGDDSAYADLKALNLYATTLGVCGTGLVIDSTLSGHADGIRFKVGSTNLQVRKGDDSAYASAIANIFAAEDGTAGAPSLAFNNDADTGFYRAGSNQVGLALGGVVANAFSPPGGGIGYSMTVSGGAFGTGGQSGSQLIVGRNSSGSGAAACLVLQEANGTLAYLWVDTSGLLRISAAPPQEDGAPADTSGDVVGSQSSQAAVKQVLGERTDVAHALQTILDTPVVDFTYANGRYAGERFTGITTDASPLFGMDGGKAFNPITAFGYLVNAIKALRAEIETLRGARGE